MGEFPAGANQDPLNQHGSTGDYWDGVQAAIDRNTAEIAALREGELAVAEGAGALMLAHA